MQIHELPSASPSASDYIPIDNGTATRKATLSSIDIGSNEITFTSGDTSSPSSWQTVAVMASNTAANLMNAISKMVANIRWLYNRLGTSSTGTTATTVTGAIAEHSTKIGSAEMGTTATTLTGAIAEVNDSINSKFIDEDVSSQVNIPFTAIEKSIIKRGDKVRVHVELNLTSFIANYNYTLWTMPTSLRPKYPVFAACYQADSNYLNTGLVIIGLRSSGNVQATFENATSPYVFIEFEYTLAQG